MLSHRGPTRDQARGLEVRAKDWNKISARVRRSFY